MPPIMAIYFKHTQGKKKKNDDGGMEEHNTKKKLQAYNCRRGILGMRGIQYWMEISVIFLDHTL